MSGTLLATWVDNDQQCRQGPCAHRTWKPLQETRNISFHRVMSDRRETAGLFKAWSGGGALLSSPLRDAECLYSMSLRKTLLSCQEEFSSIRNQWHIYCLFDVSLSSRVFNTACFPEVYHARCMLRPCCSQTFCGIPFQPSKGCWELICPVALLAQASQVSQDTKQLWLPGGQKCFSGRLVSCGNLEALELDGDNG